MEIREDKKKRIQDNIEGPYYRARGSQELDQILDKLLENAHRDAHFAKKIHTILYEFGQQKSWINVDLQQCKIWYNDSLGRPAPTIVKELFATFQKGSFHFYDVHSLNLHEKIEDSIAGTSSSQGQDIWQTYAQLNKVIAENAWEKNKNLFNQSNRLSSTRHSFFNRSNESKPPVEPEQRAESSIKKNPS